MVYNRNMRTQPIHQYAIWYPALRGGVETVTITAVSRSAAERHFLDIMHLLGIARVGRFVDPSSITVTS